MFAIFSTVHIQKQVAGEASITPGAAISACFPGWIVVAGAYTGLEDTGYVCVDLYATQGEKEATFSSAQARRPSTCERDHSPLVPLTTTAAVTFTTQL